MLLGPAYATHTNPLLTSMLQSQPRLQTSTKTHRPTSIPRQPLVGPLCSLYLCAWLRPQLSNPGLMTTLTPQRHMKAHTETLTHIHKHTHTHESHRPLQCVRDCLFELLDLGLVYVGSAHPRTPAQHLRCTHTHTYVHPYIRTRR